MNDTAKFSRYCTCGDSMHGSVQPARKAQGMIDIWDRIHRGVGHEPCDKATAQKARRKRDREERRNNELTL